MRPISRHFAVAAATAFLGIALLPNADAQISYGGTPPSFSVSLDAEAPTAEMPPVNTRVLMYEDARRRKNQPLRFGKALPVDISLENSGVWENLPNGARVWRQRIHSENALSINLTFGRFVLPDGAELYVYNDDHTTVLGSYNALNNKENEQFAVQPAAGDAITLEYVEPSWVDFHGELQVSEVIHAYRDIVVYIRKAAPQTKAAGACEVDVNCPVGAGWEDEVNAVVKLTNGVYLCTGSLLNNTANDGTQYLITASHCGNLSNAIFYFNNERTGCSAGTAPGNHTVQGSVQKAVSTSIDYRLVQITPQIPASYNPYMAGWDRSGVTPSSTTAIHHPDGDVKKISFDYNSPTKSGTDWRIIKWDVGVTEGGSSGCPLYDPNHRFIGQLWGGVASCSYPYDDYFGRLQSEWSGVSAFLDPLGTGQTTVNGLDPNGCPPPQTYGTGELCSKGTVAQMSWSGTPSVGSSFSADLTGGNTNASCVMFSGNSLGNNPQGWGTILVAGPSFLRTWTSTNSAGQASITVPVTAAMVGTTKYYQYAVRDPGFGGNVQAANGLMVTFCP